MIVTTLEVVRGPNKIGHKRSCNFVSAIQEANVAQKKTLFEDTVIRQDIVLND
jgi:hypothetical protein